MMIHYVTDVQCKSALHLIETHMRGGKGVFNIGLPRNVSITMITGI